jgi:valyl-tRNA synthetase
MTELPKAYDPKAVEEKWYRFWEDEGLFEAEIDEGKEPFTIVIPPPNITGILTMGHVLNNMLQDVLIRWRRMEGRETLWLPGTDHAGIATQNVVERELAKEGLTRHDLGREEFVGRVWKWRERFGRTIILQLKRIGCSCDWRRERFTLDEGLSNAVFEVFTRLYKKGLIYRGEYIINWCPRCSTALADEEVEHRDHHAKLYYITYPLKDADGFVTVATTRPETMLGDTAVAVHPADKRYRNLVGKTVILPLAGRELPIVADEAIDLDVGTGALKVTPAHDPVDFEIAERHGLERVVVIGEDGKMSDGAPPAYRGMDRYECRDAVMKDLEAQGLVEKVEPYDHAVGHCYRCDAVIEPYLSKQWFVKMKPLAEPAIRAVETGKVRLYPERWTKVYLHWMHNIRDWCISRQIWWGHRIPIWYCEGCGEMVISKQAPAACEACGGKEFKQDEDVLDTWFSSWLWPFSTLGWPEETEELGYFYPTQVLVTGPDIIFFWVARMIMAALEFVGEIPFHDVYLHVIIRDLEGRMMSKSLGNSPDPLELIDEFGADALRFGLMLIAPQEADILFGKERLETGRHFCNKLWNASRFLLMNIQPDDVDDLTELSESFRADGKGTGFKDAIGDDRLELDDRWILSRFNVAVGRVSSSLGAYRFNEVSRILYDFMWHELCDWYLETIKDRLYGDDAAARRTALAVALHCLDGSIRLLHPFMPFITEEIWQRLPHRGASIMTSPWPRQEEELADKAAERQMGLLQEIIGTIRNIRGEMNIPPNKHARCLLRCSNDDTAALLRSGERYIRNLAKVDGLEIGPDLDRPDQSASGVVEDVEIFVPLAGLIDFDVERTRLEKEVERAGRDLERALQRLSNREFLAKAPQAVIDQQRELKVELEGKLERLRESLDVLTR